MLFIISFFRGTYSCFGLYSNFRFLLMLSLSVASLLGFLFWFGMAGIRSDYWTAIDLELIWIGLALAMVLSFTIDTFFFLMSELYRRCSELRPTKLRSLRLLSFLWSLPTSDLWSKVDSLPYVVAPKSGWSTLDILLSVITEWFNLRFDWKFSLSIMNFLAAFLRMVCWFLLMIICWMAYLLL